MDDLDGDFRFLIELQAQELAKLRKKLEEGRHAAFTLHQSLNSLLAADEQPRCQMKSDRYRLDEMCKLAKYLANQLRPDNLDDEDEDEDDEMSLDSSSSTLCAEEENELGPDSLDENYLLLSCHPAESEPQECASRAAFPSQKPGDHSAVVGSTYTKETCAQGPWIGEISSHFSELQASQSQLEPCIQGIPRLGVPLGQCFEYGDSKARQSLSSTTWSFAVCTDCGDQCQPFQDKEGRQYGSRPSLHLLPELNLDACLGMCHPPKLAHYAFEGSAASSHGFPICGLCGADSVGKQKTARRKLKIACKFPGLCA